MTQLHQQQAVNRREAYQYGHYHGQPVRVGSQQQLNYLGLQQPQHHTSTTSLMNVSPNSYNNHISSNPSSSVQHYSLPPNLSYVHDQHQQHVQVVHPVVNVPSNGYSNSSNNHLHGFANNHNNSRSNHGSSSRPLAVYHPSHSSSNWGSLTQHINNNNVLVHAVQAAPDIPSSTGSTPSSIDSMQQQPHQIAQQTTYGRSSTSSSNISSLPGYSSTNVPGASGQGNNNGRHGLQQCYPASQYAQSSSQHSQLNQHSMMPPVNVGHHSTTGGKRVRALYNCVGENPAELSFEANAILYDGEYCMTTRSATRACNICSQ